MRSVKVRHYDRLPELAAELVRRKVAVILAGANSAALAAKAATATIPIVFSTGSDPVQLGLVPSLDRPGGNITGVSNATNFLDPKRFQLLHEMVPSAAVIAVLINPDYRDAEKELDELQSAAMASGQKLLILKARTEPEIQASFMTLVKEHAGALIVTNDAFFNSRPDVLVPLSTRHAVPTIFQYREFATAGGLMSYGSSITENYRQAGIYVGRILKGEKPSDLPIMLPTKFELIINLKTAKTLGLTVPPPLLARADEVIESCRPFAAVHESESGPKQTWRRAPPMSASGGQSGHPLGLDECLLMTHSGPRSHGGNRPVVC